MHSISDLTTFCRKTSGDVPPKLVGASTTVVGSKMYLFGGRLVTERRMISDLYVFDLETFVWEKVLPFPEDEMPPARYFHSADAWHNILIIFGGMGISPDSDNPEDLCVLNDVRFFDLSSRRWASWTSSAASDNLIPKARYAHLSSITSDRLFIIGGQDLANVWLDDVHIYDLKSRAWIQRRDYPRHCGTYRSVAVSSDYRVRFPQEETRGKPSPSGPPGTRYQYEKLPPTPDKFTPFESLHHLPYSAVPTDEYPSDVYLYSNYNFTDVKRELEVFSPLSDQDFAITDRSNAMQGSTFPPGLRFPTGAILGTHLIIAGTYLAHTYQSFSVWALDLQTMVWSRIDPGSALATGSWFRGCLWPESSKFLIFGNRYGNLVEDYNRRLLSWDHVACIDLEAFGIYKPPRLLIDIQQQELGLAALEEGVLADFEIICDDGRRIECSRKLLEERWPWLKDQRRKFVEAAQRALNTLPQNSQHVSLPDIPGPSDAEDPRPDPRLTPRTFHLSEPYPVALAFVQYFYALALITPLQHAPAVLSQLLVLASTYKLHHLEELVRHAMHRALSNSTSVGVYEVATLCSCRSLQIRALKTVMSYSQKRPVGRTRPEKDGGGGGSGPSGRGPGGGGGSGGGGGPRSDGPGPSSGPGSDTSSAARPRGMSDAFSRSISSGGSSGMLRPSNIAEEATFTRESVIEEYILRPPPRRIPDKKSPHHLLIARNLENAHSRSNSWVSVTTDNELCAVAELMSPAVLDTRVRVGQEPQDLATVLEDSDSEIETPLPEDQDRSRRLSSLSMKAALSAVKPPSRGTSIYSLESGPDVDGERSSTDDFSERAHLPVAPSAYPAFHLPRPRRIYTTSESDLPSLTARTSISSTSSSVPGTPSHLSMTSSLHTHSPPASPLPISMIEAQLEVIPEKIFEDDDSRRLSSSSEESLTAISFAPMEPSQRRALTLEISPPVSARSETTFLGSAVAERPTQPGHKQSISSLDSSRSVQPESVSRWRRSPTPSTSSSGSSPTPRWSGGGSLRFLSLSPKTDKDVNARSIMPGGKESITKDHINDAKARKAEEKRRKKEEAKARTEQLALQLKQRAAERKAEADKQSLGSGKGRDKKDAVMYGGMVWM